MPIFGNFWRALLIVMQNVTTYGNNMLPFLATSANCCLFWQLSEAEFCQKWQKSDLSSLESGRLSYLLPNIAQPFMAINKWLYIIEM